MTSLHQGLHRLPRICCQKPLAPGSHGVSNPRSPPKEGQALVKNTEIKDSLQFGNLLRQEEVLKNTLMSVTNTPTIRLKLDSSPSLLSLVSHQLLSYLPLGYISKLSLHFHIYLHHLSSSGPFHLIAETIMYLLVYLLLFPFHLKYHTQSNASPVISSVFQNFQ